jgi:hypothetical protein
MNSDGRERPNLSASLVHKLKLCGLHVGLSEDAGSLAIIERLADDCLRSGDSAEPPVKKGRQQAPNEIPFRMRRFHTWVECG